MVIFAAESRLGEEETQQGFANRRLGYSLQRSLWWNFHREKLGEDKTVRYTGETYGSTPGFPLRI